MADLEPRRTADGSYSLFSAVFGEAFHCADGALREAWESFIAPAELERFPAGRRLQVVEVAVGTGTNSAALLEAVQRRRLGLRWWGLELDPEPLRLALADASFRGQWTPAVLEELQQLVAGEGMLWGDARRRIGALARQARGTCDLVLLDAFSPRRCPQLWTVEFLADLAGLLAPSGRLITYCSAAAVRAALRQIGLHLATIPPAPDAPGGPTRWSLGTVASPRPLPATARLAPLTAMERDHLRTRAAKPYRDPTGEADAAAILAARRQAQVRGGGESTSAWRRRWGLTGGHR